MSQENTFSHFSGLPAEFEPNYFTLEFDESNLIIHQVKIKLLKNQPLQTFKIPLRNIVTMGIVTEEDLSQNNAIGNGVVGALLFGPVGAVLGGMSGLGAKKVPCFAVSYISENQPKEIKTIIFNAAAVAGVISRNKAFVSEVKEKHKNIELSVLVKNYLKDNGVCELEKNSDGSITL